ncbi:beta-lactamase family protein [Flavobacterium sediminilitoris]|uniref:Beta-lactamase family protein n=1 Tax=Flavobacterium sediminilitoris TaxID=2024526 RepID=A0ABY4HR70_9FLAO|nr:MULTISPECIES: serine hydrolase domain-containing protein [Flavobacterium]UOX35370.1 beta-lactamase family protein [Flavobacterium sediminilitoris]
MKKILCILYCFIILSSFAQSEPRFQRIDSLLTYLEVNNKFMGSLAIQEGNTIVFSKAYGASDIENNTKANEETKYKIGSITKTFTAIVIMQLIEEKKLKLDTQLSVFYPKVNNADKITINDLLHQRTGIPDYINQDSITKEELNAPNLKEAIFNKIENYNSLFEPNSQYAYSNSNYYLLGGIIEKITKKSYSENIEKRIINKIGLKNTFYPKEGVKTINNESYSYIYSGSSWEKIDEWKNDIAYAAGAIVSTPSDLTNFMRALFQGKLVKKNSLEEMKTLKDSYGMALIQFPFGERRFYGHTGGIESFRAVVGYYTTEDLGISLIVNGDNYNRNDIMIGILSIYYKIPFPFPNFEKINTELISKYSGTYSSKDIPLKINIFEKNGELLAQATGQSSFPLTLKDERTFIFAQAGIEIIFDENTFILHQGGGKFNFTKE